MISMEASDLQELLRAAEASRPVQPTAEAWRVANLEAQLLQAQNTALERGRQIATLQAQLAAARRASIAAESFPPFPTVEGAEQP